jgi:4-hydroxy-tetrahydrodipicolinate reductase
VEFAGIAAQARCVHVIGTTGMSEDDLAKIKAAARHAVVVRAGNMSLGVNLLVQLTKKVAAALDEDFDIEVIEAHHNQKVDAPSGTALMLGQAAADGRGVDLDTVSDRGRDGITGKRERGHIGFHAIRGGDIVGEHDVLFAATGERITLRHVASDRAVFARGALKAALWGQGRGPGEFDMLDVLGLNEN